MSKLPYGGFSADEISADPWVNLLTIAKALEAGEPIPPNLARWLGEAIFMANNNQGRLLINLGLKRTTGKPSQHSANSWLKYGGKIYDLIENEGLLKEQAIESIQEVAEIPRATLHRWYDIYTQATEECRRIDLENRG